ncbi:MAG: hypothetical protein JO157_12160 [Acetobacteraceae bacterium]|nr:hypothetical protein [Acetobacteraceae bacterium]
MLDLMGQLTQLRSPRPTVSDADAAYAALLAEIDPAEDTRILLIGVDTLELMCALIHRGCVSVAARRPGDRPETASAEIVVAPQVATAECADQVLGQARRALVPLGSLVMRLSPGASAGLLRHIDRFLRLHGFSPARPRVLADQVLLRAEFPAFGRLAAHA